MYAIVHSHILLPSTNLAVGYTVNNISTPEPLCNHSIFRFMSIPKHIHYPNLPRLYPNSYLHPLSTHNYALLNSLTHLLPPLTSPPYSLFTFQSITPTHSVLTRPSPRRKLQWSSFLHTFFSLAIYTSLHLSIRTIRTLHTPYTLPPPASNPPPKSSRRKRADT
jgi:hypothetical protein